MIRTLAALALALALTASAHAAMRGYPMENGQLKLPSAVVFQTGSATLEPESAEALAHVASFLASKPYVTLLRIEAHTDGSGSPAAEQRLSAARAHSVARWLVAHGVPCSRLIPVAFGSTKPVNDGSTPDGRATNRRIVFVPAMLNGRAIGSMPVDGGGQAGSACE